MENLLDDEREVRLFLLVLRLAQIHEHSHKWSLPVRRHQGDDLILNCLNPALNLVLEPLVDHVVELGIAQVKLRRLGQLTDFLLELLSAHLYKRRKMCKGDGLPAVLAGGDLRDNLGRNIAGGGERMGPINLRPADNSSVLEHILKVHEVTVVHVLGKVIRIVEVDNSCVMRLGNVLV